ncbi:pro-FMRFamide-related neuropeptide VF [Brienomyrus brachyistius]|uniref:pro-FMRFamide-related neuropeptide VF n=1 Tax=Brienomyrus brachyistius TaxID=42636 RepID=UPI0020B1DFDE|nr:pro-FMRFamide-related neuropeptide VF [Brienomyrus brachyistius]
MTRYIAGPQLMLGILGCLALGGVTGIELFYKPSILDPRPAPQQGQTPESNNENLRSLEASDYMLSVAPASRKGSVPTILRLYPTAGKVTPLHANLPLRFGRRSAPEAVRTPKSFLNLPQRFGRAQATDVSVVIPCRQCPRSAVLTSPSATLPQRFGEQSVHSIVPLRALAPTEDKPPG